MCKKSQFLKGRDHFISRYFDFQGLQVGDWAGLAGHLYTDIFSLDFLTPLTETDTQFKLGEL